MKKFAKKDNQPIRKMRTFMGMILLVLLTTQFMFTTYVNAAPFDDDPLLQKQYLSIDVGFRARGYTHDTTLTPTVTATGASEEVVFSAYVNKGRETLTSYTLTPTFTGDAGAACVIAVYEIAHLTGEETKIDSGYTLIGDTIVFEDVTGCYRVECAVATAQSFTGASMSSASDSVQVTASFDVSFEVAGQTHSFTDARTFQPLTLQEGNSDLNNNSIITELTIDDTNGGNPVTLDFIWSLVNLEKEGGGTFDLSMLAGNYYILQVDTNAIQLYTSTSGDLCVPPALGGDIVGCYYMDKTSGKVIFVFHDFVETHNDVYGYFTITSGYNIEHDPDKGVVIEQNTGTITTYPEETQVKLNISKRNSGFYGEDMDSIDWTVTVNKDFDRLKNLVITDKNTYPPGGAWTYKDHTLVVSETKPSGGAAVVLTEGIDYIIVEEDDESFTIQITGNAEGYTSSQYEISFTGSVTDTNYYGQYRNDAEAEADNAERVSAYSTATRSKASLVKSSQGFDSSTSTLKWKITYNGNKVPIPIENAVVDDTPTVEWLNEAGNGFETVPLEVDITSFVVTLGTTPLVRGTDYEVTVNPDDSFTLTLKNTGTVTGGTGYLREIVTITYETRLDLSAPPLGAVGWNFRNEVTSKDGEKGNGLHTGSSLKKNLGTLNCLTHTATWTTTINSAGLPMPDGTKIYDALPKGFTMDGLTDSTTFSIKNSRRAGGNAWVIPSGQQPTPEQQAEGYFVYSNAPFALVDGTNTINVGANCGFTLTFHPGTLNHGTDEYVISYRTSFVYDPRHVNDAGYASYSGINYAYLYYSGRTDKAFDLKVSASYTINSSYRENSSKGGQFLQSPTGVDGKYVASKISWTTRCNAWNTDINGAVFTDELLSGRVGATGAVIDTCDQVIITPDDVRLYSYKVNANGSPGAIDSTDLSAIFAAKQIPFDVDIVITPLANGNSKLTITFPNDFEDSLIAAGVTDSPGGKANMRFAVVITSTLENGLAPYYPNTATLERDGGKDESSTGLSITVVTKPGEKIGKLNMSAGLIEYTAVLNKDQKQIQNLKIQDSLAYTPEGEQILFLVPESLKIYEAKIAVTSGVTTYTKGNEIPASEYTLHYTILDTLDENKQGFTIEFDPDYTLDRVPIIVEYQCGYNRVEFGNKVANSIKMTGYDTSNSTTEVQIFYTISNGGTQGTKVDFSLKKVDENNHYLTGAQFTMLNANKAYAVAVSQVDQNGVLAFNNFVTGTYYLYESETPNGYASTIGSPENALQIRVVNLGEGIAEVSVDGRPISDETGQFTIQNTREVGSVKLTKYKSDLKGAPTTNPLSDAVFHLYKLDSANTKLYFIKYDDHNVAEFAQVDANQARALKTDASGVIEVSNLPLGRYYFEESSAPVGFLPVSDPIEFEITSADIDAVVTLDPVYDDVDTTSVSVEKRWKDNNNQNGIRPPNIKVQLLADEEISGAEIELNSGNGWTYTWTALPKYADGKEIVYTVREISVPVGYTVGYSDDTFTITNTLLEDTKISVTKKWEDNNNQNGIRPPNIKVQLLADGEISGAEIELNSENGWAHTWTELPKYTNGKEIQYTVAETSNPGEYSVDIKQNGENQYSFIITNTYTPEETSRTVIKNWNDNSNREGKRPTKISVQLYADGVPHGGEIELNNSNGWTYRWNHLPLKQNDKEIIYTVKEVKVPDGYKESYDGFKITNNYTPEVTARTITKLWEGEEEGNNRPTSIKVQLLADGKAYGDPVSLTSGGGWVYTWNALPKYADGKEIIYSVEEIQIPFGYRAFYSEDGFTITNSYTVIYKGSSDNPSIPITRNKMGTLLLLLYGMMIIISGGGLLFTLLLRKKGKRPTRW